MTAPTAPTVTATTPADAATGVGHGHRGVGDVRPRARPGLGDRAVRRPQGRGRDRGVGDASPTTRPRRTARLTPTAALAPGKAYTAQLTTAIRAADGTPMADAVSLGLHDGRLPVLARWARTHAGRQRGRPRRPHRRRAVHLRARHEDHRRQDDVAHGAAVLQARAARRDATSAASGRRPGRSSASVTYQGETASGWQRQALDSPITLQAGQTYTVSVGLNTRYWPRSTACSGARQRPAAQRRRRQRRLRHRGRDVPDRRAGTTSNYFVDAVVKNPGTANVAAGDARARRCPGRPRSTRPRRSRRRSRPRSSPASVNASTFTLETAAGTAVPATVAYDGPTRTATLHAELGAGRRHGLHGHADDRHPLRRRDPDGRSA